MSKKRCVFDLGPADFGRLVALVRSMEAESQVEVLRRLLRRAHPIAPHLESERAGRAVDAVSQS